MLDSANDFCSNNFRGERPPNGQAVNKKKKMRGERHRKRNFLYLIIYLIMKLTNLCLQVIQFFLNIVKYIT